MPVLVSHGRDDEKKALHIAEHLTKHGLVGHAELFDPETQSAHDITTKVMERIHLCTHVMVVMSNYSEDAWWLPFALGVGSAFDKRITSYQSAKSQTPEFLKKWPVLKKQKNLDHFVRFYRQDTIVALSASHGDTKRIATVDQFHRELKALLDEENNGEA